MELILLADINIQYREKPETAFALLQDELDKADLRYANMEGCFYKPGVSDIPDKQQWVHSDKSQFMAITAAGFDALGGANNVNYGKEAILSSLKLLSDAGIPITGLGRNENEAWEPVFIEKEGTKIAFVQATARYYGLNAWAAPDRPGVAGFDPDRPETVERVLDTVRRAEKQADLVIFSHHLRKTRMEAIEPYVSDLTHAVIDAGADFVYGHGAHMNIGAEIYKGVQIYHCTAQAAFDWEKWENKREGIILYLTIDNKKITDVRFKFLYKKDDKTVYITGSEDQHHQRQLKELQAVSPHTGYEYDGGFYRAITKPLA